MNRPIGSMQTTVPEPETYRWTRQQYEQMVDAGVLTGDDPVELVDGHIVTMSPQNSFHVTAVGLCRRTLESLCSSEIHVRSQAPLALGPDSEPEPDLAVVEGHLMDYRDEHPSRALLVVEILESSLQKDREQKRLLYARHDIPEYWIVNLAAKHLEVYRDPASGDYKTKTTRERGDTVTPHFAPDASIPVNQLIPA